VAAQIKIGVRRVWMHKGVIAPDFAAAHVLSENPWRYVELFLKRKGSNDALSFWKQARRFAEANEYAAVEASPLLIYYSLLNASKALLCDKGILHSDSHGVAGDRPLAARAALVNEQVNFKSGGVLPSLCAYFRESAVSETYNLKEILRNIPFVHRAFVLTFRSEKELFVPLERAMYVKHDKTREAWFEAEIMPRFAHHQTIKSFPSSFTTYKSDGKIILARRKRFRYCAHGDTKAERAEALERLKTYHSSLRRVIVNISGNRDLWYLKKMDEGNSPGSRHTMTLMFAAMHRLSELARYDPNGLDRHLSGQANWLLAEFIENSLNQFIDHIASEITGLQFWPPKMRT